VRLDGLELLNFVFSLDCRCQWSWLVLVCVGRAAIFGALMICAALIAVAICFFGTRSLIRLLTRQPHQRPQLTGEAREE
jgi:hypothetical protein